MNRRRSLAALLLSAAAVASLAVPAGAAAPKAYWSHQTLPCATGHKSATVVLKWVPNSDPGVVLKGWYDNPCPGQWLLLGWCQPDSQTDCNALDVAPRHKGGLAEPLYAQLQAGPSCDDNGGTTYIMYLPPKKAPSCPAT